MAPAIFCNALKIWLHLDLSSPGQVFVCDRCSETFPSGDAHAYHTLTCRHGSFLNQRHNAVREVIFNVAKHAGLQPRMEPQHILDDNNDRPGDVYVKGLFNGKDACIDVAITHSSQPKYIDIAALNGGAAAASSYASAKIRKYRQRCNDRGLDFFPIVFDTYAACDPDAVPIILKMAKAISTFSALPVSDLIFNIFQRLSSNIMRVNASAVFCAYRVAGTHDS